MAHNRWKNAIERYIAPRATSAPIMIRLRSNRSTRVPAMGPNRNAGRVRAIITPDTASDAVVPPRLTTIDVTATNPTQSPNDETDIAASSRANGRYRDLRDRLQCAFTIFGRARAFIVCAGCGIGADDQKVLARGNTLMAGAGRKNGDIPCLQCDDLAAVAAEPVPCQRQHRN